MNFNQEFFKNEVRNGFFVSSLMKRAWAAQIEVIADFDKVCKDNNLTYYAAYGTLLGAIRHGGFIPWDDDVDIWMPRKDLLKFRTIIDECMPKGYMLLNIHSNDGYEFYFDRLINGNKIDFSDENMSKFHGFPFMCGLDIFPLDNLPTESKRGEFREDLNIVVDIIRNLSADPKTQLNKRMRELIQQKYNFKIDPKKNVKNQLWRIYEKEVTKYINQNTKDISSVFGWLRNDKLTKKREWFDNVEYKQFENIKIPVPSGYDEVLSAEYTNYMTIKISSDGLHDFPFYKKQEPFLFEKTNLTMTSYKFDEEEYKNVGGSVNSIKQDVLEKIELFRKINEVIISLAQAGNYDQIDNLLEQSQDLAIKAGEALESGYPEEEIHSIIEELEKYCEYIYRMSQSLRDDFQQFIDVFESLIVSWGKIKDMVTPLSDFRVSKILFVIENMNDWNHYENLYKLMSEEPHVKCMVMPVPYFYRDDYLKIDENKLISDGEEIAKHVETIDYRTFDFNLEKVDCVIKSNPYDKHSFCEILHPFFHTQNLRKYCRNVVHIPTFDIMDFTIKDVQMKYMSEFFVKTPSVIYSDFILLRSEINRKTYCDLLKEVTEEVDWNKKVLYCQDEEKMRNVILELI